MQNRQDQPPIHIPIRAVDTIAPNWVPPREIVVGKSLARSLMQPQSLAMRLLPAKVYETLVEYSVRGVPTMCGPNWSREAIVAARAVGPHVSALTPENVALVWEEVIYQAEAGFVKLVSEEALFTVDAPTNLKISRLTVVPQRNRRGRLILNLSAGVQLASKRILGS
jgi:hypothetical protein